MYHFESTDNLFTRANHHKFNVYTSLPITHDDALFTQIAVKV